MKSRGDDVNTLRLSEHTQGGDPCDSGGWARRFDNGFSLGIEKQKVSVLGRGRRRANSGCLLVVADVA